MRRKHKRSLVTIGAGALAALILTFGANDKLPTPAAAPGSAQTAPTAPAASTAEIAELLDTIPVATIKRVDGYDRSCKKGHGCVYGPAWNDPQDHSGCGTRSSGEPRAPRRVPRWRGPLRPRRAPRGPGCLARGSGHERIRRSTRTRSSSCVHPFRRGDGAAPDVFDSRTRSSNIEHSRGSRAGAVP